MHVCTLNPEFGVPDKPVCPGVILFLINAVQEHLKSFIKRKGKALLRIFLFHVGIYEFILIHEA
jgi:hypothetical protein